MALTNFAYGIEREGGGRVSYGYHLQLRYDLGAVKNNKKVKKEVEYGRGGKQTTESQDSLFTIEEVPPNLTKNLFNFIV